MGGKGGGSPEAKIIDPNTWDASERAFVQSNPDVESAYRSGTLTEDPSYYLNNDYKGDRWANDPNDVIPMPAPRLHRQLKAAEELNFNKATYDEWLPGYQESEATRISDEKTAFDTRMRDQEEAIAAGTPPWAFDPTPETPLTAEDQMNQMQMQMRDLITQREEADLAAQQEQERQIAFQEEEAAKAQELAFAEQREYDLDRLDELWGKRQESEALAEQDINDYLSVERQRAALTGTTFKPDEEAYADLISKRFGEYWSAENETMFANYAGQYGPPGQIKLARKDGGASIAQDENLTNSASPYVQAASNTIFTNLLANEDEANLLQSSLLGS